MDTYDKARRDVILVGKFVIKWGLITAAGLALWLIILNGMMK